MKVALVILHSDPARGGAERYTIDLAAALSRRGQEVSLVATSFSQTPSGVREVYLDARGLTRSRRYQRFLDQLDEHLAETGYDIVHAMLPVRQCDIYHPHAGLAAAALRAMRPVRRVFNPRRGHFATVERQLLSDRAPLVICLSQYVKRAIREHYQLDDLHLPVLFNAVDLERFQPAPRQQREQINALFVGQDFHRKGMFEALAALRMLNDPRLTLTVVGRPPGIQKIPPTPGLKLVGSVPDPRPYYREADFLVLPTKHDPCSLVVLEALAMGVPVISTRFNGACEIMINEVHGYVLEDPENIPALAAAMQKLLDPQVREAMSKACLQLRPKLSYEHHMRALLDIYGRAMLLKAPQDGPLCRQ